MFSKFCSRSPVPCFGLLRFALSAYSHDDSLFLLTHESQGEPRLHFNLSLHMSNQIPHVGTQHTFAFDTAHRNMVACSACLISHYSILWFACLL